MVETSLEGYIVDSSGNKTAVVIPIEEYESLIKSLHETSPEATIENMLAHNELKATISHEWST
jgi:hypothetical protein